MFFWIFWVSGPTDKKEAGPPPTSDLEIWPVDFHYKNIDFNLLAVRFHRCAAGLLDLTGTAGKMTDSAVIAFTNGALEEPLQAIWLTYLQGKWKEVWRFVWGRHTASQRHDPYLPMETPSKSHDWQRGQHGSWIRSVPWQSDAQQQQFNSQLQFMRRSH